MLGLVTEYLSLADLMRISICSKGMLSLVRAADKIIWKKVGGVDARRPTKFLTGIKQTHTTTTLDQPKLRFGATRTTGLAASRVSCLPTSAGSEPRLTPLAPSRTSLYRTLAPGSHGHPDCFSFTLRLNYSYPPLGFECFCCSRGRTSPGGSRCAAGDS